MQSVFRTFFRKAGQGYYDVPVDEDLWKLFLVLALNKIRAKAAYHRAAKRDVRLTSGDNSIHAPVPDRSQGDRAAALLRLVVQEALEHLPEAQRAILQLRIEGYEVAEIAEKTERSKRTVERVLQDFRKKLHGILTNDE